MAKAVKVSPFHFGSPEPWPFGSRTLRRVRVFKHDKPIGWLIEAGSGFWSPCTELMQHHGVPQRVIWPALPEARTGVAGYLKDFAALRDDQ